MNGGFSRIALLVLLLSWGVHLSPSPLLAGEAADSPSGLTSAAEVGGLPEAAVQGGAAQSEQDTAPAQLADTAREKGDQLAAAGSFAAALEQYAKAAEYYAQADNPAASGDLHFLSGEMNLKLALQDKALAAYETARGLYVKAADLQGEGNALLRIGEVAVRKGDHPRALAAYSRALGCYEKAGNSASLATIHASLVNLSTIMGDAAQRKGKYFDALEHFNRGVPYAVDATSDTALLHRKRAAVLIQLKEPERAAESIAAALAVYERNGDLAAAAAMHKMQADLYLQGGRYGDAADLFARAESLYRQAGDRQGAGNALRGSGDVLLFSGQTALALEKYAAALEHFVGTRDIRGQAGIYRTFGEISQQQGAGAAAMKNYDRALALYEQCGDVTGMKVVYRCQADALLRLGEKARALELQTKAGALGTGADNLLETANKTRVQADIYFQAGDHAMALEWYNEALLLYQKGGDLSAEGNVIRAIGDVAVHAKNYPLALQQYEKALPLLERAADRTGQGSIYQMQASVAYMQGDNSRALLLYTRALELFEACHNQLGRINVMKGQADVYAARHDFARAKPLYQAVLDFYSSAGDLESQAYTLFSMAQVAVLEGAKTTALHLYEDALALLEKIRKQTGFSRLKKRFMEKVYDLYEEAVVFMIRNEFAVEALRNAESMKARVFIDQLAEGQVVIKNGELPQVTEKRVQLESRIAALDRRIADLVRSGDSSGSSEPLRKARSEAERELDSLDVNLRVKNPLYASVHYPEPVPVEDLQKKILRPDETLLEFFVSSDGVYCFVVTASSLTSVKLPLSRRELEQLSKSLLEAVEKGPSRTSSQLEEFSTALYARLLAPLEKLMKNNTVIIIPDGALTKVPFEILSRRKQGRSWFFLELNPIKYFQSATLLALQRTTFRKGTFSNSYIGFGDPVYDVKPAEGKRTDLPGSSILPDTPLPRLEASGKEVQEISAIFEAGERNAKVLLRGDANRTYAMSEEMKQYGFIHFAAHGVKYAGYQAIALSRTPSSTDNGMLTIGDIMGSSYEKSRVVVLSACQSGLGTFDRGEGVTGLTRAVMYSGSPAAVVSLWNVADSATMNLMETFYENVVSKEMNLEEALRSAKLAMLNAGRHRHPIFWGAFVMYGE